MIMKTALLFEITPIPVNTKLAAIIGLNETMILHEIEVYCETSKMNKVDFADGHHWAKITVETWRRIVPFMSKSTIIRTLKSLEDKNLIITGIFNQHSFDKTKSYRLNYEEVERLRNLMK